MKKTYVEPAFDIIKINILDDILVISTPSQTDETIPIATTVPAPEIGENF